MRHAEPASDGGIPPSLPEPCIFLQKSPWVMDGLIDVFGTMVREHRDVRPQDRIIVLANTREDVGVALSHGIPSFFSNHNAFVDEKTYRPLGVAASRFDAVYNARWTPWKRHDLAAGVERLGLIGYHLPGSRDEDEKWREHLSACMPQAVFCNGDGGEPLDPVEINVVLNQSSVGLCLSEVEGAMKASMEYMLAGLPLVSTPSRGGRDHFFDPDYCIIAQPDPRAIRMP